VSTERLDIKINFQRVKQGVRANT